MAILETKDLRKIYERYTEAEKTKSMLWMGYPFP